MTLMLELFQEASTQNHHHADDGGKTLLYKHSIVCEIEVETYELPGINIIYSKPSHMDRPDNYFLPCDKAFTAPAFIW